MAMIEPESNADYHADKDWVSASVLKDADKSWRIVQAKHIEGTIKTQPTKAMEFGTAVHTRVLEPHRFWQRYCVEPDDIGDRRRKRYRDWKESIHPDQTILTSQDAAAITECESALRRLQLVDGALKAAGEVETSYRWKDEETGVPCKIRPDKTISESCVLLDIKTCRECTEKAIANSIADFGYHIQAAHYAAGAAHKTGSLPDAWCFLFAFVETSPPYRSMSVQLDAPTRFEGQQRRFELLREYARRKAEDDWRDPHELNPYTEISLPRWYGKGA